MSNRQRRKTGPRADKPIGRAAAGRRARVIAASLELFNRKRERDVTTNHIAAYLEISPGNLYYYFKNKEEIISELYRQLEQELLACLTLPAGRRLSLEDIATYLHAVLEILWRYRFFFREASSLVGRIPAIHARYAVLIDDVLGRARAIYAGLAEAGMLEATAEQIERLARNSWIVTVYWFTFLETRARHENVTQKDAREGVLQLVALFYPYLSMPAKRFLDGAIDRVLAADAAR